ncbi:MAG: glycosyltransferase, partial [Clostridia bacterium]|nr:glycosyltransferase [Clostridia bacterium]
MKAIFAAGGTGGHVNPAIAAAEELRRRHPDAQILFIGTATKIEAKTVPAAGFDFKSIDVSGFQRKLSVRNIFRNIAALFRVFKSSFQAKKIIAEFKPDVAVGFGGYVSGPVLREARKAGVKTVI